MDFCEFNKCELLPDIKEMTLSTSQVEHLQALYTKIYPKGTSFKVKRCVQCSHRAQSATTLVSSKKGCGEGINGMERLMYGEIEKLFESDVELFLNSSKKQCCNILAKVNWLKSHPCKDLLGFPRVVCIFSFFSRILYSSNPSYLCVCAFSEYCINPNDKTEFTYENVAALALVQYLFSEFSTI